MTPRLIGMLTFLRSFLPIRTSVQKATKLSPFELMYMRKPKLPIEMEYLGKENNDLTSEGDDDWNPEELLEHAKIMFQLKEKLHKRAGTNIKRAQEKDKIYYDNKHSDPKVFSPGTLVLLRNSHRDSKKGDKMKPHWLGPYRIHEALDKGVYRLENLKGVVLKAAVNQCCLKLYHTKRNSRHSTDKELLSDSDDSLHKPPPKRRKSSPSFWVQDLSLNYSDKNVIEKKGMLSDKHVHAAHALLGRQFPHLDGLQSPLLVQNSSFQSVTFQSGLKSETIQILYVPERQHWVTTSCHNAEVRLYDSKFSGQLTASLEEQIVCIYKPAVQNDSLRLTVNPVQQQAGGVDCGLYSIIAFAYHAALGHDLEKITFEQARMRQHLLHCLEKQLLTPFPPSSLPPPQVERNPKKQLAINLYCICDMPESYDSEMVECDKCQKWFHFKCIGLKDTAITDPWFCAYCLFT